MRPFTEGARGLLVCRKSLATLQGDWGFRAQGKVEVCFRLSSSLSIHCKSVAKVVRSCGVSASNLRQSVGWSDSGNTKCDLARQQASRRRRHFGLQTPSMLVLDVLSPKLEAMNSKPDSFTQAFSGNPTHGHGTWGLEFASTRWPRTRTRCQRGRWCTSRSQSSASVIRQC